MSDSGISFSRERSDRVYCQDLSRSQILSPTQERDLASQIHQARCELWSAFLSYPRFVSPICAALQAHYPDFPADLSESMLKAVEGLPNGKTKYAAACKKFVERASDTDRDEIVVDLVLKDVSRRDQGKTTDLPFGTMARIHKKVLHSYLLKIQRARAVLQGHMDSFVNSNLRLVVTIARRFGWSRLSMQDLIQEGNLGLMKAIKRFDHTRGLRFSTFSTWWIRHAITRAIADKERTIRFPVHIRDLLHKIKKFRTDFETMKGRPPSAEETCAQLNITLSRYENAIATMTGAGVIVSLDQPISEIEGSSSLQEVVEDEGIDMDQELMGQTHSELVGHIMTRLTDVERDILTKRFNLGGEMEDELTLSEIGEQYQLSRERIRQIQEQALSKLRRAMGNAEIGALDV